MDKYVVEKVIGEGTYGIVYKAKEKATGDFVAIKKFKTAGDEQLSKREIQACSMLTHPNIVSYRNSFRHDGLLHLVFDYVCSGMVKLLSKNKKGVSPQEARKVVFQLCKALEYCHSSHIIHRDVKPDNILIDESGDIKLCDFGVARTVQFEGDAMTDYVSTRWYRPPEQELRLDRYYFDADIWSVGCVLMELLTGRPIFPGSTQIEQINLIQSYLGPLPAALLPRVPRGVVSLQAPSKSFQEFLGNRPLLDGTLDFLVNTLQLEPKLRLSAKQCLDHPFLRSLRDAERRDRENQRRVGRESCLSDDEGIEEDIPGQEQPSRIRSTEYKADQKAAGIDASVSLYKSRPHSVIKNSEEKGIAAPKSKLPRRSSAKGTAIYTNNTECDSDDIQEIIEAEDFDSPSRSRIHQHQPPTNNDSKLLGDTQSRSKVTTRRGPLSASAKAEMDPLDGGGSGYEDDFEEYHHGYE